MSELTLTLLPEDAKGAYASNNDCSIARAACRAGFTQVYARTYGFTDIANRLNWKIQSVSIYKSDGQIEERKKSGEVERWWSADHNCLASGNYTKAVIKFNL